MSPEDPVQALPPAAVPLPVGSTDRDYHCPNCKFLPDPEDPRGGFWACQNLCERD